MMFDVANNDDVFGYIHSNPQTGQIAAVGTLCKVTDRQLLEDGRQYIALEGKSRFRVTKILKTLPYILAEVDLDYIDEPVDEIFANKIETETYDALKFYIRLMRTYDANKDMVKNQNSCTLFSYYLLIMNVQIVMYDPGGLNEHEEESPNKSRRFRSSSATHRLQLLSGQHDSDDPIPGGAAASADHQCCQKTVGAEDDSDTSF